MEEYQTTRDHIVKLSSPNPKSYGKFITALLVIAALCVRLKVYIENRSLVLDEANLALNIIEKDYKLLWGQLDYEQVAPPLFLIITKIFTALLGNYDFVFRMPVMIAGMASVLLFYSISKNVLKTQIARWYILFMFGFSILIIRYSTEFKQYAFDMIATLLILWMAVHYRNNITKKKLLLMGVLGIGFIWLSMPIIFVLPAMGLSILLDSVSHKNKLIPYVVAMGGLWLGSFYLYYKYNLSQNIGSQHLQNFHSIYFINLLPTTLDEAQSSLQSITRIFKATTDKTFVSIAWAMLTLTIGMATLIKRNRVVAIFVILPLVSCLVASHLHMYSLIPRLLLFLIPLILLGMGIGVDRLWIASNKYLRFAIAVILIITGINTKGYQYLYKPMEYENIKSVAQYLIHNRKEGDLLIVHHDAVPAFRFYNMESKNAWKLKNYRLLTWDKNPREIIESNTKLSHFYILVSHAFPQQTVDEYIGQVQPIATLIDSHVSTEASAYYFETKIKR